MGLGILKALHQSWSNGQPVKVQNKIKKVYKNFTQYDANILSKCY